MRCDDRGRGDGEKRREDRPPEPGPDVQRLLTQGPRTHREVRRRTVRRRRHGAYPRRRNGSEFYVIVDGKATLTRGGREVAVLGPGNYFGELALLDGQKRDATVTTSTPADVLVVGVREFVSLLEDVPQLTRKLLAGMARRLHELDSQNN